MCERTKTAVEMLKQRKANLTKGEIIMVFEKVIEDQRLANKDIRDMKQDVGDLKTDVAVLKNDLKDIKELILERKKSFWDKIPLLKDVPNLAWFLLIVSVCIVGSLLGANLDFLKDALHITGG